MVERAFGWQLRKRRLLLVSKRRLLLRQCMAATARLDHHLGLRMACRCVQEIDALFKGHKQNCVVYFLDETFEELQVREVCIAGCSGVLVVCTRQGRAAAS